MDNWLTSIDLISPFSRILFPTSKNILRVSKVSLKVVVSYPITLLR